MKIANNIIKEHLKNVYFLCGGAYGGKTTMARLLAELREEAEFTIADLLSFPKDQKIIVDGIIPLDILKEISDYEHVFLLFAPDEMKLQHYFDRADKDEVYQFILSFPDGKEFVDNVIEALNLDNEQERRNMLESGFKFLERMDHDTVEGTLKIIEKHFGL